MVESGVLAGQIRSCGRGGRHQDVGAVARDRGETYELFTGFRIRRVVGILGNVPTAQPGDEGDRPGGEVLVVGGTRSRFETTGGEREAVGRKGDMREIGG